MTPLPETYDVRLVALSVIIAVFAGGAALDLAGRVTATHGRARAVWFAGGAFLMGLGIWSMHYTGMLAFRLPVDVRHHVPTVVLSLLAAVIASAVAFRIASEARLIAWRTAAASVAMGLAIAGMHYIGMAAMRLPATATWSPPLVLLSIAIAIAVSAVALRLAFRFGHTESGDWTRRKIGAAVLIGAAVPSMHYAGMMAVSFTAGGLTPDPALTAATPPLAGLAIGGGTMFVLLAAIAGSIVDRRIVSAHDWAAEALRASEARYHLLFDANPVPTWVFDRATDRFLTVNDAAVSQYGYSRDELLAMTVRDIRLAEEVGPLMQYVEDRPPGRFTATGVWHHRRKDGSVFRVELTGEDIVFEGRPAIIVMAMDPERERAQTALRIRERQLAAAQALAHVGSWEWDIPANLVTWSDELYRLYGVPVGSPASYAAFVARVHPDDRERVEAIIAQGLAQRLTVEYEYRIVRPAGEERHVLGRNVVMTDGTGKPVGMAGTSLDITHVKAGENKQQALIEELQTALAEVKTLRGILPICANCKRVRTEQGSWEQVESYVRQRTNAEFSHGLCPDCAATTWGAAG